MTEILIWTLGGLLLLLGLVGCFVPVVPGPMLGYASLWVMCLFGIWPSTVRLWIGGAIVVAVFVIDCLLPSYFAKKFKCSKIGVLGCFLGTIVGLFFIPWGIIFGPILGTMLFELVAGKSFLDAAKGGAGAFCGFVSCLLLKLAVVGLFCWWFVDACLAHGLPNGWH